MLGKDEINKLEACCGVYIFYKKGKAIYIGKAINIKARIKSHLANAKYDQKEYLIIKNADRLKIIKTVSDFQALILEARLIKQYEPKYNFRAKDDKSYLYIKITVWVKYPKISLSRAENDGKSLYFGPFKSSQIVSLLLREIRRVIPYCTQKRITGRACFYSKIGLCSPCPNLIEKNKDKSLARRYKTNIRRVIDVLADKSDRVIDSLEHTLNQKIKTEDYEEAIIIRSKIERLNYLTFERSFTSTSDHQYNPYGQIKTELTVFLKSNKLVGREFEFGEKFRVECFDVSNLFGKDATASMVVFIDGAPMPSEYRRFKIKGVKKISDFDMMAEVVNRRFGRQDWPKPDLIVVDGGKPQLNTVLKIIKSKEIEIPVLGIAKRPDRIVVVGANVASIGASQNRHAFNFIRAIRDESHRFAKKYHLYLRKQNIKLQMFN